MSRRTVYNEIVTDKLWEDVNEENKELLTDFVEYLESISRAQGTIKNYTSDMRICFIWCLENNKNKAFTDFTKRDIMRYQNYLLNTLKLSSSRIKRLRSSLSSLSNFIESILDDDYPEFRNIIRSIPAPDGEAVRQKTVFEDEDLDKLLEKLTEKELYQEACALSLAMNSGSRKAELPRFKVDYFKPENIILGSLYQTPEKIVTKGRGGKLLTKYVLASNFQPYLDRWLEERDILGIESEYLLVTKSNGKWEQAKVSTLNSWANRFNKYIDKHFYWHANRHYFTTSLSKSGIPAEVIKQIVGWESVEMVSVYNDTTIEDELGKYFNDGIIEDVEKGNLSDL